MHQDAFPGEDISDRPPPEDSVPGLLALIEDAPSGRHRAPSRPHDLRATAASPALAQRARAFPPSAERLEAHEPPEARGLARDDVRLLVATRADGRSRHRALRRPPAVPGARATCSW